MFAFLVVCKNVLVVFAQAFPLAAKVIFDSKTKRGR